MFPMLARSAGDFAKPGPRLAQARQELQAKGHPFGPVQLGAMIEVPAAAIMVDYFFAAL